MDRTNADRAAVAGALVAQYRNVTEPGEELEIALADLLTDLRHWANTRNINYDHADGMASEHYLEEFREEELR